MQDPVIQNVIYINTQSANTRNMVGNVFQNVNRTNPCEGCIVYKNVYFKMCPPVITTFLITTIVLVLQIYLRKVFLTPLVNTINSDMGFRGLRNFLSRII